MTLQNLDTVFAFAVIMLGVSLLITVFTQMLTSFLGLRGQNLKRGLADLLRTVHPDLSAHAEEIAQQVLEHPLVSDSIFAKSGAGSPRLVKWWRLASAVRVDELLGILEKLSAGAPAPTAGAPPATWTPHQAMAAIAAAARQTPAPQVQALAAQVGQLANSLPAGTATNVTVQLDRIIQQIPATAEAELRGLKSWFDSAMDRTAQRFTLHARLVTVVLSVLFVFGAHLDTFRVLKQLSADPVLRQKLIGQADLMLKQGQDILDQTAQTPAQPAAPQGAPPAAPTKPPDDAQKMKDFERLKEQAKSIKEALGTTGFQLIPDPYPGPLDFSGDNLWGILASAVLLSLGAPFWFNMLKSLSNLRPVVATKQEEEQAQKST